MKRSLMLSADQLGLTAQDVADVVEFLKMGEGIWLVPARGTPTLWTRLGSEARGGRTCIQSPALGPQGIEPRSVVPETTVLSVELQAHFSARYTVSSMETYCARMVVAAATGGECYPNSNGIKARL